MKTIVVGYDGTRPAERALRRAAELARAFGAEVIVVSVAPPQPPELLGGAGAFGLYSYYAFPGEQLSPPVERDEDLWRQHREQVEAVFAEVGVRVDFAGIAGDPADELIEAADQRQADLIVVGTREPGLVERLLGGSVSQAVARRAHCDVLIVHPGDAG